MEQQQAPAPKKQREGLFRRVTKRFHIHRHDDDVATAARSPAAQPAAAVSRRHTLTDAIPSTATSATLLPAAVTLQQPTPLKYQTHKQPEPQSLTASASSTSLTSITSSSSQSLRRHSSAPVNSDAVAEVLPPTSMLSTGSNHQFLKSASARLNVVDERIAGGEETFDESEYNEDDENFVNDVEDEENEENQDGNNAKPQTLSRSGSASKKNPMSITLGLSTAEGLMGHDNEDRMIVEQNESFHMIAVLDGHGGGMVADFVKEKLFPAIERCYDHGFNVKELSDTIESLDQQVQDKAQQRLDYSGACMICVLLYVDEVTGLPQTLTLNVGDCRAIMHEARGKKDKKDSKSPNGKLYALSEDHCEANTKEKLRVLASGAYIEYGRIGGVLEPFRSIGDIDMKESEMDGWVIATPEIKKTRLLLGRSTMILATDGVWGSLVNQKVMAIARKFPNDLQAAADAIVTAAREAGSLDDIAVVVVTV